MALSAFLALMIAMGTGALLMAAWLAYGVLPPICCRVLPICSLAHGRYLARLLTIGYAIDTLGDPLISSISTLLTYRLEPALQVVGAGQGGRAGVAAHGMKRFHRRLDRLLDNAGRLLHNMADNFGPSADPAGALPAGEDINDNLKP